MQQNPTDAVVGRRAGNLMCHAVYRGGEKGPQGSGTKTVSICVAWTHRGVERYARVFPCFRPKHTMSHLLAWVENKTWRCSAVRRCVCTVAFTHKNMQ
jgi:hypothetical protein